MPRAKRVCTEVGCPVLTDGGRCAEHRKQYEANRGTFRQRGYRSSTWDPARRACLRRDPICVLCHAKPSTVADHHPVDRRTLLAQGAPDPDALYRLRGLCIPCHNTHTALSRGGG